MAGITEGKWEAGNRGRVLHTTTGMVVAECHQEADAKHIADLHNATLDARKLDPGVNKALEDLLKRNKGLEEIIEKYRAQEKKDSLYRQELERENASMRARLESTNVIKDQQRRTIDEKPAAPKK